MLNQMAVQPRLLLSASYFLGDSRGFAFRLVPLPTSPASTLRDVPSEMANNLGILVAAWLWNLWSLLRSFGSLTTRKPKLPLSSSQSELETGLYSPRTNGKQQRKPPGILRAHPPKADPLPSSSSNLRNFRFTFEASPSHSQQSFAQRKEFLPHPSLELKTRPARRSKRSRESVERKRLRRGARIPDFAPPPEIYVEDWSLTHDKKEGDSEETSRPPPIFIFGPGSHQKVTPYPVPSVIITPSTPSEENASRINSGPSFTTSSTKSSSTETTTGTVLAANFTSETPSSSEILRGLRDDSDVPGPTVGSPLETVEAEGSSEAANFYQTARVSIHLSDDSSSVSAKDAKSPKEGQFVFSDSLTKIAFGPSQQSPTISPPDPSIMDQPQAASAISDWEAPSFHPISSSTPRLGDRPIKDDNELSPDADVKVLLVDRYSRSLGLRNSSVLLEVEDDHDRHGLDLSRSSEGGANGGGACHSVLPYPEIFDFDMYTDFRASMAVFGISSGDDLDELAMAAFKRLSGLNNHRTSDSTATSHATIRTRTQMRDSERPSRNHHLHRRLPSTPDEFSVDGESPSSSGVRPPTLSKFRFSLPIVPIGMEDIQTRDSVEDAFAHSTPMVSLLLDTHGTRAIMSGGRTKGADDRGTEYSCEDAIAAATSTATATVTAKRGEYDISAQFRFPIPAPSISRTPPAAMTMLKKVPEKALSSDSSPESSPDVFSSARSSSVRARVSSFTESLSHHNKMPSHHIHVGTKNSSLPTTATPPASSNRGSKPSQSDSRKSGYSAVQVDSEIKRYRDRYRHPAYSRSPPLPGEAFSNSSSFSSESKYQDSLAGSVGRDSLPLPLPLTSSSTTMKSLRTYPTTSKLPRSSSSSLSSSATVAALESSSPVMRGSGGRKRPPPVDVGVHESENASSPGSEVAAAVGYGGSPRERGVRRVPTLRRRTTMRGPLRVVNSNEIAKPADSGGGSTVVGDLDPGGGGGAGASTDGSRERSINIKERLQQRQVAVGASSVSGAMGSMMRKVSMKRKIDSGLSKSVDIIGRGDEKVDQGNKAFVQDQDTPVRGARVGGLKRTPTLSRRRSGGPAKTTSGRTINLLREVNRQEEQRRAGIFPSSDTMNNMTLGWVYASVN